MPQIALGPVLYARSSESTDEWRFGIGVLVDDATAAELKDATALVDGTRYAAPDEAHSFGAHEVGRERTFLRWDVAVKRHAARRIQYRLDVPGCAPVTIDGVAVPGADDMPAVAFFSCNGVSSSKLWHRIPKPFERWEEMQGVHASEGIHLLIGGGDQIYADGVWDLPALREFAGLDWQKWAKAGPASKALENEVLAAYVDIYAQRWSQPAMRDVLSRVPGLFTWDDHDIFDGWGSHGDLQKKDVFKAVFAQARRAFFVFQLGCRAAGGNGCEFLSCNRFLAGKDALDVVLPDTRSYREAKSVLGAAQWKALDAWFAEQEGARTEPGKRGRRHVLFVSPVPVVYLRVGALTELGAWVANLRDDLVDQWESPGHRGERARLIMTLLDHQAKSRSAVTILSGDVHVGARAEIQSRNPRHVLPGNAMAVINQITSSGIVHPPPTSMEYWGLRRLASAKPDDIGQQVETLLMPLGGSDHLLTRNWALVRFKDSGRNQMLVEWRAGDESPQTKVFVDAPD